MWTLKYVESVGSLVSIIRSQFGDTPLDKLPQLRQDDFLKSERESRSSCIHFFVTPWTTRTVHGILLAKILEWVALSPLRTSSQPKN